MGMFEDWKKFKKRKNKAWETDRKVTWKDIGGKGRHYFTRVDWEFHPQSNPKKKVFKVFVVERLHWDKVAGKSAYKGHARTEYRIGYYIVGKNGNKKNKWTWGQSCPVIPQKDLKKLIKLVQKISV